MTRFLENPVAPLASVLAALAAVLGVAEVTGHGQDARAAPPVTTRAPVESAIRVCPEPSLSRVSLAVPPGGRGGEGGAEIKTLGGDRLDTVGERGALWTHDFAAKASPVVVRASGDLAAGLEVEQTSIASSGVSGARCAAPTTGSWFLGDAVDFGRATKLFLTDVDDTAASVNVDIYGPRGPITAQGSRGITVRQHRQKVVGLDTLAGDTQVVAVHVYTTMGRVAAAVHTRASGGTWAGTDWLPPAPGPGRELVVPGVPKGRGERRLVLAAPGDIDATVRVQLVTSQGTYAPHGQHAVDVPAGSVEAVNIGDELNGRAAAVRVSANVPVTATVSVSDGKDTAYVPATSALSQSAVVSGNRSGGGVTSTLLLSAPQSTARVRVTTLARDGTKGTSRVVKIPGKRTVSADLSPRHTRGTFGVIVTPVGGSTVYGARMVSAGDGSDRRLTLLPLTPSPSWVRVPSVDRSLSAAIPGGPPQSPSPSWP